jgi:hypothetical protein
LQMSCEKQRRHIPLSGLRMRFVSLLKTMPGVGVI